MQDMQQPAKRPLPAKWISTSVTSRIMRVESYQSLHFHSTPAGGTCLSGEGSGDSGLEVRLLDSCHCCMKKGDGFLESSKGERRERRGEVRLKWRLKERKQQECSGKGAGTKRTKKIYMNVLIAFSNQSHLIKQDRSKIGINQCAENPG